MEGRPESRPVIAHIGSSWDRINPQFFETVGSASHSRARTLWMTDTATSPFVAVVNKKFVKKFFPKEDPIGHHFGSSSRNISGTIEIVGVVADAKYTNPRDEVRPMYFRPLTQQLKPETPNEIMAEGRSLYINSITLRFNTPPQNVEDAGSPHARRTSIPTSQSKTYTRSTTRSVTISIRRG